MRSSRRKSSFCPGTQIAGLLALTAFGIVSLTIGFPQTQNPTKPMAPDPNVVNAPTDHRPDLSSDPNFQRAEREAIEKRNLERQQKMTSDSDKLLLLAQELNSEVEKKGNEAAPVAAKKAEEIAKLAKSISNRMRSE